MGNGGSGEICRVALGEAFYGCFTRGKMDTGQDGHQDFTIV